MYYFLFICCFFGPFINYSPSGQNVFEQSNYYSSTLWKKTWINGHGKCGACDYFPQENGGGESVTLLHPQLTALVLRVYYDNNKQVQTGVQQNAKLYATCQTLIR